MSLRTNSLALKLLTALVLFAAIVPLPARAQVVSVLDEHNQRVFINLAPVLPKPVIAAKADTASVDPAKGVQPASGSALTPAKTPAQTTNAASNFSAAKPITNQRLEELIQTTAARHHVDPALVRAVMETESGGNPTAVSRKGALGLMQLMPTTAMQLGVKNVFSPDDNLDAGVRYLRSLLERYNGDLDRSLAAYNAGMGAVDRAGGVPRYRETRDYVRKVTSNYFASDSGKAGTLGATKTPLTAGSNALGSNPPAAPHKQMYKSVDAQGHVVWSND